MQSPVANLFQTPALTGEKPAIMGFMRHLSESEAADARQILERVQYELKKVMVGQSVLLERLLTAVLAGGHVLVEGAPGLAKTLALKTLSKVLAVEFKRIQFTPDLLPADLVGTRLYHPGSGEFSTEQGPIFAHFILADEINRAPAKVQSALLEAMQEHQVTIGKTTYRLHLPFLVMATQNPIESEGTYPLPEAQLDRFLFKVLVPYPDAQEEFVIIQRMTEEESPVLDALLNAERIIQLQRQAHQVYLDPKLMQAIVTLVSATRHARPDLLQYGVSPRGSLALAAAGKARALLHGRTYVVPEDLIYLVHDALRHRLILTYDAMADGWTPDKVLDELMHAYLSPELASFQPPAHTG